MLSARPAHLPVQEVGQGASDGVVLALILKQGAAGFLGFHIAGLGGVAEGLGEDALGEDQRVGGNRHVGQPRVAAQLCVQGADHHPVAVGGGALIFFIDPADDFIERVLAFGLGSAFWLDNFFGLV